MTPHRSPKGWQYFVTRGIFSSYSLSLVRGKIELAWVERTGDPEGGDLDWYVNCEVDGQASYYRTKREAMNHVERWLDRHMSVPTPSAAPLTEEEQAEKRALMRLWALDNMDMEAQEESCEFYAAIGMLESAASLDSRRLLELLTRAADEIDRD